MRQGILIGGIALLSAVAVAGWVRKPAPAEPVAAAYQTPAQSYTAAPQYPPQYPMDRYGQSYSTGAVSTPQAYAPQAYATPYASSAVYRRPAAYSRRPVRRSYDSARYTGYADRYDTYADRRVVRRRPRPFSHSLAIVGGGTGAGAAIGALAGGGKGAGIGALAGGAAGLIYDRLTHNR